MQIEYGVWIIVIIFLKKNPVFKIACKQLKKTVIVMHKALDHASGFNTERE